MKKIENITLLDEIEKILTEPYYQGYAGGNKEDAILRISIPYSFIQYPRAELKLVMEEIKKKSLLIDVGIEEPTASDKLLITLLMAVTGKLK